jgi:hypothetical protein
MLSASSVKDYNHVVTISNTCHAEKKKAMAVRWPKHYVKRSELSKRRIPMRDHDGSAVLHKLWQK